MDLELLKNKDPLQIKRELEKKGIDLEKIRKDYAKERLKFSGLSASGIKIVLLTENKKWKQRTAGNDLKGTIDNILGKSTKVVARNLNVFVWYNPESKIRNKKASKILGFDVFGDVVFSNIDNKDLILNNFMSIIEAPKQ